MCSFYVVGVAGVPTAELVSLHPPIAMQAPDSPVTLHRDEALSLVEELLALRQLVERVGGDLRNLAARSRHPGR